MRNQDNVKAPCNWLPAQCEAMREKVRESRLAGVIGLEQRVAIKIEVRNMDYNALRAALR